MVTAKSFVRKEIALIVKSISSTLHQKAPTELCGAGRNRVPVTTWTTHGDVPKEGHFWEVWCNYKSGAKIDVSMFLIVLLHSNNKEVLEPLSLWLWLISQVFAAAAFCFSFIYYSTWASNSWLDFASFALAKTTDNILMRLKTAAGSIHNWEKLYINYSLC